MHQNFGCYPKDIHKYKSIPLLILLPINHQWFLAVKGAVSGAKSGYVGVNDLLRDQPTPMKEILTETIAALKLGQHHNQVCVCF